MQANTQNYQIPVTEVSSKRTIPRVGFIRIQFIKEPIGICELRTERQCLGDKYFRDDSPTQLSFQNIFFAHTDPHAMQASILNSKIPATEISCKGQIPKVGNIQIPTYESTNWHL